MELDVRPEASSEGLHTHDGTLRSTFTWVNDLINRGTKSELEEKDVPELSPSFQSKPVFERFMEYA